MKLQKFKISLIIFTALIMLQPALLKDAALAAETTKSGAVNPIATSLNELLTVRDDTSLSEKDRLLKELELRKKILSEVLTLSLDEVIKLTAKVDALPKFAEDSREKELRDGFKLNLESYTAYYTDKSKKLAELTTIDQIKSLAQKIKEYRDNAYNPQIKQIVNFLLLFYNEDVLKIANTRLDKISADIKKLEKLGYIKTGAFADELQLSAQTLSGARALLEEAKSAVLNPPKPEEALSIKAKPTPTEEAQSPVEPNKLVESSLNKVKSAYDTFLQISKSLRKILGIE